MKYLLTTTLLILSITAKADQLGSFGDLSSDFRSLFNSHRFAMPDKKPWAGSFFPYASHGISDTTIPFQNGIAPSLKYDRFGEWEIKHTFGKDKTILVIFSPTRVNKKIAEHGGDIVMHGQQLQF